MMEYDAPIKNDVQVEGSKYITEEKNQVTKQNSVFYFCKIIYVSTCVHISVYMYVLNI